MDTKKDNLILHDQNNTNTENSINEYKDIIKKTEKITAAIYLVSGLFDENEPLKEKIRLAILNLIQTLHALPTSQPISKHVLFEEVKFGIREVLSYIEIAKIIGFISDMNSQILIRELQALEQELLSLQAENTDSGYKGKNLLGASVGRLKLTEDLFTDTQKRMPEISIPENKENTGIKGHFYKGHLKDLNNVLYGKDINFLGHFHGRQNIMSNINDKGPVSPAGRHQPKSDTASRINRRNNIIMIIRTKKDLPAGEAGVTIKDISSVISDCSEKTVQRELNSLVSEGVLKREGKKRWSRYSIV